VALGNLSGSADHVDDEGMDQLPISYPPPPVDPDPMVSMSCRILWLVGLLDQVEADALRLLDSDPAHGGAREMLGIVIQARAASKRGLSAIQLFGDNDPSRLLSLIGRSID
jgi:hypothetical protein